MTFTAAASGIPAPSVQWQVSTDGGATWNSIAGATSTNLTFAEHASQTGTRYRVVFSGNCGTAATTAATLTLSQSQVRFTWNVQPSNSGVITPASGSTYPL